MSSIATAMSVTKASSNGAVVTPNAVINTSTVTNQPRTRQNRRKHVSTTNHQIVIKIYPDLHKILWFNSAEAAQIDKPRGCAQPGISK